MPTLFRGLVCVEYKKIASHLVVRSEIVRVYLFTLNLDCIEGYTERIKLCANDFCTKSRLTIKRYNLLFPNKIGSELIFTADEGLYKLDSS